MRLKIDTEAKTIQLEQSAKIVDVLSLVKKLLPNDWKDYSFEAVYSIYSWTTPIYYPPTVLYNQDFTLTTTEGTETFYIETKN